VPDNDNGPPAGRREPVTIAEAARTLGISIRDVYQRVDDGELYPVRGDTEMLVFLDGNPPD